MALKFAVRETGVKAIDLVSAQEGLLESIEEVSAAAEALYNASADGAELCQVMDNLQLAAEALENGGLTAELIATFNSEGELSACCGQESLTVAGLEAMAEYQVSKLEDAYAAGLEGKLAQYWAKFVAWLKNLWAKLVNWFKAIFTNRAKYVSVLAQVQNVTEQNWNGKAKCSAIAITSDVMSKMADLEKKLLAAITNAEAGKEIDRSATDKVVSDLEGLIDKDRKESTVDTLTGSLGAFKGQVKAYIDVAKNQDMQNSSKKLTAMLDKLVKRAEKAANIKDDAAASQEKDAINKTRDNIVYALGLIRAENRFCMKLGANYVKIFNAGKSAKAK